MMVRRSSWLSACCLAGMLLLLSSASALSEQATPVAFPLMPEPALCHAEPASPEVLASLLATPIPASPGPSESPPGDPAPGHLTPHITQAIVELFACLNAGEPLRAYAQYSDNYLPRILTGSTLEDLERLATPTPLDEDEWTAIVEIRDIRLLDDGRVYATVVLDPALIPVNKIFGFFLIQANGHWLIDDVLDELEFSLP